MATTEPRAHLRAHLVTLLAAVYGVTWWLFAGGVPSGDAAPDPAPEAAPEATPAPAALAAPPAVRWYRDLAPAERARVAVPSGWHVVGEPGPATAAPTAPVRVRAAPARHRRIRTRSS